jgi:hypothetical protein
MNVKTMRKTLTHKNHSARDVMKKEYRFDYSRAKPNRFARNMPKDAVAIILEPDVAARFKSSEAVNAFLRSVIDALPNK